MNPSATVAAFQPWTPGVFSLAIYTAIVLIVIALLMFVSSYIGEKKKNPEKSRAYESGIIPTGPARLKFPVPFYLANAFTFCGD